MRGVLGPEGLNKFGTLVRDRSDSLSSSVEEHLGHGWLVRVLNAAVQTVVRSLKCHLHKGIGREPMSGDKRLAVALEFKRLTIVLTDQVRDPRLGEPNSRLELGGELPGELLGDEFEVLVRLDLFVGFRLVKLALGRELCLE